MKGSLSILLIVFASAVSSRQILAPDEDFYLVVTVRNDTTFEEFYNLFKFYVDIRASCPQCIPPISNTNTLAYFGQYGPANYTSLNNTADMLAQMNTSWFHDNLYTYSKSNFSSDTCSSGCVDLEAALGFISVAIKKANYDPSQRIRKKQISVLSNYYYTAGYDRVVSSQTYSEGYNATFFSLFFSSLSYVDSAALQASTIPYVAFDASDKSFNYSQASYDFLNRYIDFDYDKGYSPVAGFIEISGEALMAELNFFSNVFDTALCRFTNTTEFYEMSLLISFGLYQHEIYLPVPNLQGYTQTYVNIIVQAYLNSTFMQEPASHRCEEPFYVDVVERLRYTGDGEQFNFYVTNDYPTCMVQALNKHNVKAASYTNHFEVYIHSPPNSTRLDEAKVFEDVASKIIPPINASQKANRVVIVDLTNATATDYFGICLDEAFKRHLTPAQAVPYYKKPSDWIAISGVVLGFTLLSGIVIVLLTKTHEKIRLKRFINLDIRRRETERSQPRLRLASTLIAASNFATEVVVEGQGPAQYLAWRICPSSLHIDYTTVLGKGSSATIYSGVLDCRSPLSKLFPSMNTQVYHKCTVAVKASLVYGLQNSEQFDNEMKSMTVLGWHPNICAFLGWSMAKERPCLVFECIPNDLLRYVKSFRDKEPPLLRDILAISWQIANGMAYIAQHKLVHRDLACRNILLTDDLRVKITDFGLCCDCEDHSYTYTGTMSKRLPIKWLSPEALLDRLFSEKSDVWSFGVVFYEILTLGVVPYATMSNEEMVDFLKAGKRLEAPEGSPEEIVKLMKDCWQTLPEDRPKFSTLRDELSTLLHNHADYGYICPSELLYSDYSTIKVDTPTTKAEKRHSCYPRFDEAQGSSVDDDDHLPSLDPSPIRTY